MSDEHPRSPFPTILAAIQAVLHPNRHLLQYHFADCSNTPIRIVAAEPHIDAVFMAIAVPTLDEFTELSSMGHAERFGSHLAHDLLRQLDEHAAAVMKRKKRPLVKGKSR